MQLFRHYDSSLLEINTNTIILTQLLLDLFLGLRFLLPFIVGQGGSVDTEPGAVELVMAKSRPGLQAPGTGHATTVLFTVLLGSPSSAHFATCLLYLCGMCNRLAGPGTAITIQYNVILDSEKLYWIQNVILDGREF